MKNILVPIGILPNTHYTLQYAIDFSAYFKANIFLIDIYNLVPSAASLVNIKKVVKSKNKNRIKEIIAKVNTKNTELKVVNFEGNILDGIENLNNQLKIDLIIIGQKSNDINEELFLGQTSGSIVKKTNIPVLLPPNKATFTPPNKALMALKKGKIKGTKTLISLNEMIKKFNFQLHLLLVKTPGLKKEHLNISENVIEIVNKKETTESPTVYQGVLENMKSLSPDFLIVIRRKRGFFEKLWESNVVYKKDFHCNIPLLVLKEIA